MKVIISKSEIKENIKVSIFNNDVMIYCADYTKKSFLNDEVTEICYKGVEYDLATYENGESYVASIFKNAEFISGDTLNMGDL